MKIIYAKNGEKVKVDGQIHNPDYYDKPVKDAESVQIYGDYPKIVADYEALGIKPKVSESSIKPVIVKLEVGITPELQKVIDDAKAECEKVQNENKELTEQLATSQGELISAQNLISELQLQITKLQKPDDENADLLGDDPKDPKNKK